MNAATKIPSHAKFPIGLSIASAIVTGLAPLAAIFNIYFSADTRSDSISFAWSYANVALACVITLVWPAVAMIDRRGFRVFDIAAIFFASMPAMLLSMWLSSAGAANVFQCLLFQLALACAMQGALLCCFARSPARELAVAIISAVLALGIPLVMYLQMEFLGGSSAWCSLSPVVAAARISTQTAEFPVTFLYFITGVALIAVSARKS